MCAYGAGRTRRQRPSPSSADPRLRVCPVEVDSIIAAIGQNVESDGLGVESNRGRLVVDKLTLETPLPGVFAGGDAVLGPASVVEAVGQGIEAAELIHRYLRPATSGIGRLPTWPKPEDIEIETPLPVRWAERAADGRITHRPTRF